MTRLVLKERATQQHPAPHANERVIIAVDLSRSKWVYACRWGGQEQRRLSSAGELRHLQALVAEYGHCQVELIYEACGFGYEIAWWAQARGLPVTVVPPSTVEKAPGAAVKTDGRDAGDLARRGECGMLKGIHIPSREQHEYRQLSRTYAQALKDRKRQQVRLRLLLQEHGRVAPPGTRGWSAYTRWLAPQALPAPVARCVSELLELRQGADRSVTRLARALWEVARLPQYRPLVKALCAQGGIGWLTAIRFVLEVGDIHRFATADSLPYYLGLTPSEYSSGDTIHRGRVRRCGPGVVRAWLVQCAWRAVNRGNDSALRACFQRVAARAGRKRAIVAVARKLALRLRARWLEFEAAQPPAAH